MRPFDTTDRSMLAEDEYFRRRDAETLERAREAERITRERAALAGALGSPDTEALLARVVALCEATGRAEGGCFRRGALSSQERSHIAGDCRRLRRRLIHSDGIEQPRTRAS